MSDQDEEFAVIDDVDERQVQISQAPEIQVDIVPEVTHSDMESSPGDGSFGEEDEMLESIIADELHNKHDKGKSSQVMPYQTINNTVSRSEMPNGEDSFLEANQGSPVQSQRRKKSKDKEQMSPYQGQFKNKKKKGKSQDKKSKVDEKALKQQQNEEVADKTQKGIKEMVQLKLREQMRMVMMNKYRKPDPKYKKIYIGLSDKFWSDFKLFNKSVHSTLLEQQPELDPIHRAVVHRRSKLVGLEYNQKSHGDQYSAAFIKKLDIQAYYDDPVEQICGVVNHEEIPVFELRCVGEPQQLSEQAIFNNANFVRQQLKQQQEQTKHKSKQSFVTGKSPTKKYVQSFNNGPQDLTYKMAASPLSKKKERLQFKDVEVENTDYNSIERGQNEQTMKVQKMSQAIKGSMISKIQNAQAAMRQNQSNVMQTNQSQVSVFRPADQAQISINASQTYQNGPFSSPMKQPGQESRENSKNANSKSKIGGIGSFRSLDVDDIDEHQGQKTGYLSETKAFKQQKSPLHRDKFSFRGMSSFGGKPRGLISDLPNVQVIAKHKLKQPRAKSNQGFFHDQQGQVVGVPLRLSALSPEPSQYTKLATPNRSTVPGRKKNFDHVKSKFTDTNNYVERLRENAINIHQLYQTSKHHDQDRCPHFYIDYQTTKNGKLIIPDRDAVEDQQSNELAQQKIIRRLKSPKQTKKAAKEVFRRLQQDTIQRKMKFDTINNDILSQTELREQVPTTREQYQDPVDLFSQKYYTKQQGDTARVKNQYKKQGFASQVQKVNLDRGSSPEKNGNDDSFTDESDYVVDERPEGQQQ